MSNDGNGPDLTIDSLLAEGERAFSEGRVDDARELFERILAVDGAQATALNNLAVLCHQSGDLGQAETLFLRAAVLQSDPADALINLSAVAQHDQRLPEAAAYLERALELRGETPRILEQMANMAEVMGDPITGKQLWRKALSQAVQPESAWLAAFHEVDITPSLDAEIHLQGFFGPARAAQSVSSPLKMQLLLLEDGYRHRTLIVSADLFGFGPEMVELIRSIAGVWGVSPAAVILNASHTHYAPGTVSHAVPGLGRLEPEFAEAVCHAITAAMPTLYLSLQPSALSWGRASCQIGFNRRKVVGTSVEMAPNTDGFYETETPLLLVSREDGQRCLLVNHGCHPTGLGNSNQISADFPGALRDEVVRVGSADVVMFLQGAAGNLKQGALAGERAGWICSAEDSAILGQRLAQEVVSALPSLQPVWGSIRAASQPVILPLQPYMSPTEMLSAPENNQVPRPILENWANTVESVYPGQPAALEIEVNQLSIGPILFTALPGEPMAETAAKMRQLNTRHEVVFCLGYTNGLAAYFPTDDMIHEGGYEGHAATFVYSLPAPLNVGTEASILEASYAGGHAVAPLIEPPPASPRPLSEKHAFFVMSTGRSGTQTLSQVLKFAQNASVWHHPQPYMIMETQSAYWGQIDTQSAFWQGRGHYIRQAWDQGLIHGETDHNMTPFCGAIARDIPNAKFIILVRDPREFVRSGMRRNYYRGTGAWEDGRLRPQQGDADFDTWSDRDQFSQICWLWNETYRHIERIRAEVGEDRIMVIRFEDLIAGPETTGRLFDFLGLDGFDRGSIEGVLGQKLNAQQSGNFPHPSLWSEAQHRTCWDIVKEMAVRYGYPESYTKQQRGAA